MTVNHVWDACWPLSWVWTDLAEFCSPQLTFLQCRWKCNFFSLKGQYQIFLHNFYYIIKLNQRACVLNWHLISLSPMIQYLHVNFNYHCTQHFWLEGICTLEVKRKKRKSVIIIGSYANILLWSPWGHSDIFTIIIKRVWLCVFSKLLIESKQYTKAKIWITFHHDFIARMYIVVQEPFVKWQLKLIINQNQSLFKVTNWIEACLLSFLLSLEN